MDLFLPIKPTAMMVNHSPDGLAHIAQLLQGQFTVQAAGGSQSALEDIGAGQPDVVLLDLTRDAAEGRALCRRLHEDPLTYSIPVILLTGGDGHGDERAAMESGAADLIRHPDNARTLLARMNAHLGVARRATTMRVNNEYLEREVAKRMRQFAALQDTVVLALASLAETRDDDTGNHLVRTQHYMRALVRACRHNGRMAAFLTPAMMDILFKCAPLHDIGKVGIPDRILLKEGRYDAEEMEIMRKHTILGYATIDKAQRSTGLESEFFEIAKEIAYSHHERWDGQGYPQGLRGESIPFPARLMAVADVYDALVCKRCYKEMVPHDAAVRIITDGRGRQFDPDVVDAFLRASGTFQAIAIRLANHDRPATGEPRHDEGDPPPAA